MPQQLTYAEKGYKTHYDTQGLAGNWREYLSSSKILV